MKIRLVGAEMFHADGRTDGQTTDMTKLIVAFRNFANAPNKNKILGRLIVTDSTFYIKGMSRKGLRF
jgi:hypothetical protein